MACYQDKDRFASCKHFMEGVRKRKGSGFPYFVHPRGVAYIVMEHGGTVDQINAAGNTYYAREDKI